MDKSFNDQELSDIMKEIEALEDDFKIEEEKFEASTPTVVEEVMEHMMEAAPEEKVSKPASVIPIAASTHSHAPAAKQAPASHHHHTPGAQGTSMSFKVSGDINLQLEFDVGGKIVNLAVTETGLSIQMEGGMTFSVPLKKAA